MMVSVLIVNYHTGTWLPPLLERLWPDPLVEEILILNNSPEERLDEVAGLAKVRVVDMKENLGFGRAMNRGAAVARGDWWLLINPDTLPDPGCVGELVAAAEAHQVLVAGPRFYWDRQKAWRMSPATGESYSGLYGQQVAHQHALDFQACRLKGQQEFARFWEQRAPFPQAFLSGACLLIRNDAHWFPAGRIFDERFFLYYEDTDLCARLLLSEQLMLCVPQAEVIHFWDQAPGIEKGSHMQDAQRAYWAKYYGPKQGDAPVLTECGFPLDGWEDRGLLPSPPVFEPSGAGLEESYLCELGLSPLLVPKVQRTLVAGEKWMSPPTWAQLAPRQYYLQIRSANSPYPLAQWTWKKS